LNLTEKTSKPNKILEKSLGNYTRYQIPAQPTPNLRAHPTRFNVRVSKPGLARLLIKELIQYRADLSVVTNRPCVYGVFSGPLAGFSPRSNKCVGCLRCTVQYPDIVQVEPNPDRLELGDSYITPDAVDTLLYEATTGNIPVRGAGYRGAFGGSGWDGMWLDMSEIVRPTRDGIHGREFISTSVDLGWSPPFLSFNDMHDLHEPLPQVVTLPIPMLLDRATKSIESDSLYEVFKHIASKLETLAFIPIKNVLSINPFEKNMVPIVTPNETDLLDSLNDPKMIELDGWSPNNFTRIQDLYPDCIVSLRWPISTDLDPFIEAGVRVFHLMANYHGQSEGHFILDSIRSVHEGFISKRIREEVTLIGSGGITSAEHLPKAIACGLDAVALNTPLMIGLQAEFIGECRDHESARISLPAFEQDWAIQRLINLIGAWNDQLLEVLGAMGLREVRRLRGEVGRVMFQDEIEQEIFGEMDGFNA
jgi:hypothetical protein